MPFQSRFQRQVRFMGQSIGRIWSGKQTAPACCIATVPGQVPRGAAAQCVSNPYRLTTRIIKQPN
jgi:hypothetical protein